MKFLVHVAFLVGIALSSPAAAPQPDHTVVQPPPDPSSYPEGFFNLRIKAPGYNSQPHYVRCEGQITTTAADAGRYFFTQIGGSVQKTLWCYDAEQNSTPIAFYTLCDRCTVTTATFWYRGYTGLFTVQGRGKGNRRLEFANEPLGPATWVIAGPGEGSARPGSLAAVFTEACCGRPIGEVLPGDVRVKVLISEPDVSGDPPIAIPTF